MAKRALLVIDVQDYFETAGCVIDETLREITLAKKRGAAIVVVEYAGCGFSNSKIVKAVENYPNKIFVTKHNDGGGAEIHAECVKNGIPHNKLRVVGVNRSYCVHSTLHQLKKQYGVNDIQVSEKGTWCDDPETGLSLLRDLGCELV